jgi:hypothetical protein
MDETQSFEGQVAGRAFRHGFANASRREALERDRLVGEARAFLRHRPHIRRHLPRTPEHPAEAAERAA